MVTKKRNTFLWNLVLISLLLAFIPTAFAQEESVLRGWVYDLDPTLSQKSKDKAKDDPVYEFLFSDQREGKNRRVTHEYRDLEGNTIALIGVNYSNGHLIRYEQTQHQTGYTSSIEVQDDEIIYRHHPPQGEVIEKREKKPRTLAVGPSVTDILMAYQDEILNGSYIQFQLAVADRQRTLGFRFQKNKIKDSEGNLIGEIELKPTNSMVALFVKKIIFTLNFTEQELLSFSGSLPPKKKISGEWEEFYGKVIFEKAE
jgi:hypothetical protein